jgi:NAD(P)-dependent dehydrogenase (short-subunit alcohol dehydrogenase family)
VTFVNIAPGPTRTDRLRDLLRKSDRTIEQFERTLPTGRVADPAEIGEFVRFVVQKRITAINGSTINFDMGLSSSLL